jgi:alkyl hydroperoxide reductase subunit D
MPIELWLERVPDYARDLRANLTELLTQPELSSTQAWGTALSCAIAARSPRVTEAIEREAAQHMAAPAILAAKAAAAMMSMTNVYYRFRKLSGNPKYDELPPNLKMGSFAALGRGNPDFDLWCLAVSAINGCEGCVRGHEHALREQGIGEETVLAAIRIASVIFSLSAVMETATVEPAVSRAK